MFDRIRIDSSLNSLILTLFITYRFIIIFEYYLCFFDCSCLVLFLFNKYLSHISHLYIYIRLFLLYNYQSNVILKELITDLDIEFLEKISKKTDYINGYYS